MFDFKIVKKLFLLVIFSVSLSACTVPLLGKKAGVQITSNPQGMVLLNSESSGQTPVHQENLKPGDYAIKISPLDTSLQPWESKITLTAGTITVVDRQLAVTPDQAGGYILYFEKMNSKEKTEVNITSLPSTVSVLIDGNPAGLTPFSNDSLSAGGHRFTFTATGFEDKTVNATVMKGFRLNINVDLTRQKIEDIPTPTPIATPSATPSATPMPRQSTSSAISKPYVKILDTPTNFLRVRSEPKIQNDPSNEVTKVNPDDKYPYLDSKGNWYQIEYTKGKKGWISSTYATLVE